ncbi:MAG: response regulator transcription factor, partial [Spirochaetota bacterium]|nr:response regulator transcription factor [Spirochaetota bacterium]
MPEKSDFKNYIKVCIIDDDESYRLLLKKVLEIDDRIKLYGEYSTGKSFIKDLGSPFKPDVCLVDIYLNDISGIECCKQIKEKKPEVHLIVMTAHPDPQTFVEARKLGADYLQKGTRVEAIINKIITSYESKRGESLI